MNQTANAEKQVRYRKKEQLKRQADQMLLKWQSEPWKHHLKTVEELRHLIEAAIKLPFGWTEEDYLNAKSKLLHVYSEIVSPVNQLSTDVLENRNNAYESVTSSDLPKLNTEFMHAEKNTKALAAHLISALKLSACNEADQAAALMEAARFVGRTLTNNRDVPSSSATATCLATIAPIYPRPDWFAEKLASTLKQQIHPEILHKIAEYWIK